MHGHLWCVCVCVCVSKWKESATHKWHAQQATIAIIMKKKLQNRKCVRVRACVCVCVCVHDLLSTWYQATISSKQVGIPSSVMSFFELCFVETKTELSLWVWVTLTVKHPSLISLIKAGGWCQPPWFGFGWICKLSAKKSALLNRRFGAN